MLRIHTLIIFLLINSSTLLAAANGDGGSPVLDFTWRLINLLVLVMIIYKIAKKPVIAALSSSAEAAKKSLDEARSAEEKIQNDLIEMNSKIEGLEKETLEMVEIAKKDAEKAKARIVEEGKLEIQRMKEQASFALKQEKRKAEDDLRRWIAEESVKLASINLKKKINSNFEDELVKDFVNQINQNKGVL